MAPPARVPLYSALGSRSASRTTDARLINGIAEKSPVEEGGIDIYKRPGFSLYSVPGFSAGTGMGITNWNEDLYFIIGDRFYKNGTLKGTVDTTTSYTFSSCLGATPKLFLKNTVKAYTYDDGSGLVQVTDVNYPAVTVRGCAYLDGTIYVMTPDAVIWGSNFNDPQTWDALNFIRAQIEPDEAVCLTKQLVYVVAQKKVSTEIFYDAGNPAGSPLGSVQGSKSGVGEVVAESTVRMGDDVAWLGTTTEGDLQVMLMSKVHAETVSTPPAERLLRDCNFATTYAWAARVEGHRFYVLTSKFSNLTLVFDLSSAAWYIWTDPNGNYIPIVSATYTSTGISVLQHESNGNLYTISMDVYQDDGVNFPVSIYTPPFEGGLRIAKDCTKLEVVADWINTNVGIQWSDDDYQTFNAVQTVNLAQDAPWLQDGSSFRRRAYLITNLDSTFLRLRALDLTLQPGNV